MEFCNGCFNALVTTFGNKTIFFQFFHLLRLSKTYITQTSSGNGKNNVLKNTLIEQTNTFEASKTQFESKNTDTSQFRCETIFCFLTDFC